LKLKRKEKEEREREEQTEMDMESESERKVEAERKEMERKRSFLEMDSEEKVQPDSKRRKLNDNTITSVDNRDNVDYKGVPVQLRKFKWLYEESMISDEDRKRIIDYMTGKYKREDVESEDVVLKEESELGKKTVFRMCFKTKTWKKIVIRYRKSV